jgi:hypothetical protein
VVVSLIAHAAPCASGRSLPVRFVTVIRPGCVGLHYRGAARTNTSFWVVSEHCLAVEAGRFAVTEDVAPDQ